MFELKIYSHDVNRNFTNQKSEGLFDWNIYEENLFNSHMWYVKYDEKLNLYQFIM